MPRGLAGAKGQSRRANGSRGDRGGTQNGVEVAFRTSGGKIGSTIWVVSPPGEKGHGERRGGRMIRWGEVTRIEGREEDVKEKKSQKNRGSKTRYYAGPNLKCRYSNLLRWVGGGVRECGRNWTVSNA